MGAPRSLVFSMATAASGSALALCVLAVAAPIAAAQNSADTVDWLDTGYTSEYKAASVVTSLWLAGESMLCSQILARTEQQ